MLFGSPNERQVLLKKHTSRMKWSISPLLGLEKEVSVGERWGKALEMFLSTSFFLFSVQGVAGEGTVVLGGRTLIGLPDRPVLVWDLCFVQYCVCICE